MLNPGKTVAIRKMINKPTVQPLRSSVEEALALILDQGLTTDQLCEIREDEKCRKANIYPNYQYVGKKKKDCRPANIIVTDTIAKVSLQDILNHPTNI